MTTVSGIKVVAREVPTAGAVTWWTISGEVDREWLVRELARIDIGVEAPAPPAPKVALRRALNWLFERRSTLIRSLPAKAGFAVVDERGGEEGTRLEYQHRFAFWINEEGELECDGPGAAVFDATFDLMVSKMGTLEIGDVSPWLVQVVHRFNAVRLRDSGGIYFVPFGPSEEWLKLARVFDGCAGASRVFALPALQDEMAVAAISSAVIDEAASEVARLNETLDAGEVGARALETRKRRCIEMQRKLLSYEELLGVSLGKMREQLHQLDARISEAILVMEDGQ